MGSKTLAILFVCMLCMLISLPPAYACQQKCQPPYPPYHRPSPPSTPRPHPPSPPHHRPHPPSPPHHRPHPPSPPHHGGGKPPKVSPPITNPPVIMPPIIQPPPVIQPPVILPPPVIQPPVILPPPILQPPVTPVPRPPPSSPYPPYTPPGGGGGGGSSPPTPTKCPIDALKLGLCLDVLSGLIHVGIGNPVENVCCPVIQGLLELEAAVCLCTIIRLKLLNLNIFLPIALQLLATCGMTPPPGFVCPPLV